VPAEKILTSQRGWSRPSGDGAESAEDSVTVRWGDADFRVSRTVAIQCSAGLSGGMQVADRTHTVEEPRELIPPRERLIEAATRLFCRYGVNSIGVDAIVEAANTAKTTLYKVFGSKDGLVEAVLEREGRTWRAWFLNELDGSGGTPIERLRRIGPVLRIWFDREDFYGCPFINAVAESDKSDDRMRSLAIAHKQVVLARLSALCRDAGLAEPDQVAHTLGIVIDGAIVAALITRNPGAADAADRACKAILSAPAE
jgi:AcrR family transcriptional regulator